VRWRRNEGLQSVWLGKTGLTNLGYLSMMRLAVMGIAMLAPQVAAAADLFVRPASCVRIATSQYDICEVWNLFRCTGAGLQPYRAEDVDEEGVLAVATLDADYNLVEGVDQGVDSSVTMTVEGSTFAEVIATEKGSNEMVGELRLLGMRRPIYGAGTTVYEGETVEWAGVVFHRIKADAYIDMPPPMGRMTGGGSVFYNADLDLAVDEIVWTQGMGNDTRKQLKALALPGQLGFGAEMPSFGCQHVSGLDRPVKGAVL